MSQNRMCLFRLKPNPYLVFNSLFILYLSVMSITPATESLSIPQFIKYLDDPQVNQKFIIIIRTSGSLSRPNAFKFEPDLYAHLTDSQSSLKDLVKHYYNMGVETQPICSRYVIAKLFPTLEYDNLTFKITNATQPFNKYATLAELVTAELYSKPGHDLLDWVLENHFKVSPPLTPSQPTKYKLVIQVHIGNIDIGARILTSIFSMLAVNNLFSTTILVINQTQDYLQEIKTILQQAPNPLNYIITTTTDFGTDIQPYFLTLYYLTRIIPGFAADYILKLHTKSDIPTMTTMLAAFSGAKLSSAIAQLDNPASSNIDIIGAQSLVMPNYHVKELLTKTYPLTPTQDHNKFSFVAGSSFLSRFNIQQDILAKYANTLIKQSLFNCQYYTGWLFDKNSPAHALERIIGGFESQASGKHVASIQI